MAEATTQPANDPRRVSIARFVTTNNVVINLQFEGAIKRTAGLKPDTWRAVTTLVQFDKLQGNVDQIGKLQLYCTHRPADANSVVSDESMPAGEPDVVIDQVQLVDAEPAEVGTVFGEDTSRAVVFRLVFCDSRCKFQPPRGGRLTLGVINPTRKPDAETPDANTMTTGQMIGACFEAMGLTVTVPAVAIDAPKDVKWLGNPAVPELAKLLSHAGLVFLPKLDGTFILKKQGEGEVPSFPQTVADVQMTGADRRAKILVVASYPTAAIETVISGNLPSDAFEFVYLDKEGKWQTLPTDAPEKVKKHDPDADGYYRYLRLKGSLFDPRIQSILTKVIRPEGTQTPLYIEAKVAEFREGQWRNAEQYVQVPVVNIISDNNILAFGRRLGTVTAPTGDFDGQFVPLEISADNLVVTMSMEQVRTVGGKKRPKYFEAGYERGPNGNAIALDESATINAMADGQTEVLTEPSLELINDLGATNEDELKARALKLANAYFAGSANPTRIIKTPGYAAVELDGVVSEHEIDQMRLQMTVRCNTWHRPSGGYASQDYRKMSEREGSGVPHEAKTAAARSAKGSSSAAANVTPVSMPPLPTMAMAGIFPAKVRGPFTEEDASSVYAWDEVEWPVVTGPSDQPPAIKVDGRNSGTAEEPRPAIEINQLKTVPAESIVWIHELAPKAPPEGQADGTESKMVYAFAWGAASPFFLTKITAYVSGLSAGGDDRYEWAEMLPDGSAEKPDGRTWQSVGMARAREIGGRSDVAPGELVWMWAGLQVPAATTEVPTPAAVPVLRFHAGRRDAVWIELRTINNTKSNWYNASLLKWTHEDGANSVSADDPFVLAVNAAEPNITPATHVAGHIAPVGLRVPATVLWRLAAVPPENYGRMVVAFEYRRINVQARVQSNASGGGKYNLRIYRNATNLASTSNLATSDFGTLPASDDAIGWYALEAGTSAHALTTGVVVNCQVIGLNSNNRWVLSIIGVAALLPTGSGKGKVLQILDDLSPGTVGWDYPRFR